MSESALLLLRMIGSLIVVAALLWGLTRLARARGLGGSGQDLIAVRAQRGISRSTSLILVQVGAKHLLLGVADGGVRVLSEGDDLVADPLVADQTFGSDDGQVSSPLAPPVAPVRARSGGVLERLRDRTVRKPR